MPKRSSTKRGPEDANEAAFRVVQEAIGNKPKSKPIPVVNDLPSEKNPAAVQLGRLGGLKGGKARAASLTAAQRAKIAKNAAKARWAKDK